VLFSLYNNIRTPGQLQPSATFYLFKEGIEPKWEDPKNLKGGSWTVCVNRGPQAKQQLDAYWLSAVSTVCSSVWQVFHQQLIVFVAVDRRCWVPSASSSPMETR
jgi:hypothetical protein